MNSIDQLLKTIRGVSKTNPVTQLQLAEIIRRLWSDQGKIIQIIYNEIINNTSNIYQSITNVVNEQIVNNTTVINQSISQIIRTKQDENHESCVIEHTVNVSETVESSWSVLPYNQQMGEFKAVVAVRNKVSNTIVTLISLFSFDYSDATPAVIQNNLLTDAGMTLTLGVNGSNMLYATVSGMPADAKRIHFCYERCVLAERAALISGEMNFDLGMSAVLTAYAQATGEINFELGMSAVLTAYAKASGEMNFALGMSAVVVNAENPSFIFTIGAVASTAITLPLPSGYTYNCIVDWGDGTTGQITSYNDTDATHTYSSTGDKQIKITGICQGFDVDNGAFKSYIKTVENWGNCDFRKLTFYGCSNLTSIPLGSITGANSITKLENLFRQCSSLASIPSDLFDLNTLVAEKGFAGTFYNCSSLVSIPAGLFDKNTLVSTMAFLGTFSGCSSLTSIPVGLFDKNTLVSTYGFDATFYNCSSLTSIPSGLFDKNTLVSYYGFGSCFANCSSLTSIPAGLFDKNINVEIYGFHMTFMGCINLTSIPSGLFLYNINCKSFDQCFRNCINIDGNVPELWIQFPSLPFADTYGCFYNCTLADNYDSIPDAWKNII